MRLLCQRFFSAGGSPVNLRDRAKAQVRDVPHDVERHTVVEIIAYIGHTEEMYQMVLAVINQRNDDLSVF